MLDSSWEAIYLPSLLALYHTITKGKDIYSRSRVIFKSLCRGHASKLKSTQYVCVPSQFSCYSQDVRLIWFFTAGHGSNNILADFIATRPPVKVDEATRKVSLTLPGDAEAAVKHTDEASNGVTLDGDDDEYKAPTEEEKATLRKVPANIPLESFTLCIVEFAERASYYGAKTVFNNFIQFPLPAG